MLNEEYNTTVKDHLPTEMVIKVKGNWIPSHPTTPAKEFKCTACQGLVYLPVFANECYYNYCPSCGSKNR